MKLKAYQKKRAKLAEIALNPFITQTGSEKETVVRDLLSDIRHWCDVNEINFDDESYWAEFHYNEELRGED